MNKRSKSDETFAEQVYVPLNDEMDFEEILSQAINEGLTCISTIVAPVLRAYLDDAVAIEIGRMKSGSSDKDVKTLEKGLEKLFGFGAKVFEKKILEALYAKLSLDLETEHGISLSEGVKKARKIYESKMRKGKTSKKDRHMPHARSSRARKG